MCIVLSLILFAGYLPAQVIEKSQVDSIADAQAGSVKIDGIKQSDNTAKMEAENDSTAKADTISQKISDKEKEELRKEKKKALIGLAIVGGIIVTFLFLGYVASELGSDGPR